MEPELPAQDAAHAKDIGRKDSPRHPKRPIIDDEIEVIEEATVLQPQKIRKLEKVIDLLKEELSLANANIKAKDRTIFQQQSLLSRARASSDMMKSRMEASEVGS